MKPDVIAINCGFPNPDYLKMISGLRNLKAQSEIIVHTETTEPRYINKFKHAGAGKVYAKKDNLNTFILHLNKMDEAVKQIQLT